MTFGIGTIDYSALYTSDRTIDTDAQVVNPNEGLAVGLVKLPSEAVRASADGSDGATLTSASNALTSLVEAVQAQINTARVQAGSQYAALESSVSFTTDLTAQYELGFNTVNDVNFSMETAHLAKNQILQQAATAMLSQANQGQQGLLQLIQR